MPYWIVENTLFAGALAVVCTALCSLGRLRPGICHVLWVLVLIKLVMPPVALPFWPALPLRQEVQAGFERLGAEIAEQTPWPGSEGPADPIPARPWLEPLTEQHGGVATEPRENAPVHSLAHSLITQRLRSGASVAPTASHDAGESSVWDRAGLAAVLLWGLGTLLSLVHHVRGLRRLRRQIALAEPAPPGLMCQVRELARRLGVACPRVGVLATASSPAIVAVGQPYLFWPASMLEQNGTQSRASVIMHELAHLRRGDHWTAWGMLITGCFWWWNPLYWLVRRRVEESAELACDAWAVWGQPEDRAAYAAALLDLSRRTSSSLRETPVVGASRSDFLSLQKRLSMILHYRASPRMPRRTVAFIVLAFSILIPTPGELSVVTEPRLSVEQQALRDAYRLDARRALKAESWDESVRLYRQSLAIDDRQPTAWRDLGRALLHNGEIDRAREALVSWEEHGGLRSLVQFEIARCHALADEPGAALAALNLAVDAGWHSTKRIIRNKQFQKLIAHGRVDDLLGRMKQIGSDLDQARQGVKLGEAAQSDQLLASLPKSTHVVGELAKACFEAKCFDRAATLYARLAKLGDSPGDSLYKAARAHAMAGQSAVALDKLKQAIGRGLRDAAHLRSHPDLEPLRDDPRFVEAVESAARAEVDHHVRQELVGVLSKVFAATWPEARRKYASLCQIFPREREHSDALGIALMQVGEPGAALEAFLESRTLHQGGVVSIEPAYYLAWAHGELGRRDSGIDILIEIATSGRRLDADLLKYDPRIEALRNHTRFNEVLAQASRVAKLERLAKAAGGHYYKGHYAEAVRGHRAALELDPNDGERVHWLGRCLLKDERPEEALEAFRRQVQMGYYPDYANFYLACASALVGDEDGAFAALDKAIQRGWHRESVRKCPDLKNIRDDRRWRRYVSKPDPRESR